MQVGAMFFSKAEPCSAAVQSTTPHHPTSPAAASCSTDGQ